MTTSCETIDREAPCSDS